MGKGIQNFGNVDAADATWPSGKIRDNNGTSNGTRFNSIVYQDVHQTMAKLLRDSETLPNNLFDNDTNGYQYYTAMRDLLSQHRATFFKNGAASSVIYDSDYSPIIIFKFGAAAGHVASLSTPNAGFTGLVTLCNYSANAQNILDQAAVNTINGAPAPYSLASMRVIDLKLVGGDWVIQNLRKL